MGFFLLTYFIVNNRINERYKNFEEAALSIVDSYSHTMITSKEAHEIISKLLNEKLMVASQAVMLIEKDKHGEGLSELADRFQLDEIHLYNKDGKIIYSKGNKYIGWKAYEGHPVYDFMISNKEFLVEDIRQDSESDVYYKYAYVKGNDDTFVQIGVMADNIQKFLGHFEIQELINSIIKRSNAKHASFIDQEYKVVASSSSHFVGLSIKDESMHNRISSEEHYSVRTVIDNNEVFEVCVPVFYGNERLGTLSVAWLTDETDAEIRGIINTGLIIFFIVISVTGGILSYAYKKNKSRIKIAYYDKLTGLPNSEYLLDFLEEEIKSINKKRKAILLLNCINFKTLNMTYGFNYGNQILIQIADKVNNILGPDDKFFRFNSERFVLVVSSYDSKHELMELAQDIVDIFKNPFLGGLEHQYINSEISIVEIKHKNVTVDKLLQDALLALSHKQNGNIYFYEDSMEEVARREDKIEKSLRAIIKDDSSGMFFLQFQPKLDIRKNLVMGFEALARLRIQGMGNISPIEFIDIAEKNFLIYDLGNIILQKACMFIKVLNDSGYDEISVAVNISGIQLLREEFIADIVEIVKISGVDTKSLEFEITESVLFDNFDLINEKLKDIKRMGISISLDDFGTGFSSLARLHELNIDTVKLDKYFIDKIKNEYDENLISADIISMSHNIGLLVVAEGVEEEGQKTYLEKHECDIMQGYLLSKPLHELDAIEFLEKNNKVNTN